MQFAMPCFELPFVKAIIPERLCHRRKYVTGTGRIAQDALFRVLHLT